MKPLMYIVCWPSYDGPAHEYFTQKTEVRKHICKLIGDGVSENHIGINEVSSTLTVDDVLLYFKKDG